MFTDELPIRVEEGTRIVLSNPRTKTVKSPRITIERKGTRYSAERIVGKQAFCESIPVEELGEYINRHMQEEYRSFNSWDGKNEYQAKYTKKEKLLFTKRACEKEPEQKLERSKKYLIPEGKLIPPLVDMGVFTKEGKVVRQKYDKFRQINRFVELVDDELSKAEMPKERPFTIVDFGCGKSYLTFILYYYLTEIRGVKPRILGLDLKEDVIRNCNGAAKRYGYDGLSFEVGDIKGYRAKMPIDMVVTLHACDTATDYALANAVEWGARLIYSVPCCQHEVNGQIATERLSLLTDYGILKERISAIITDAVRAKCLTACGYKTQVLEFVDMTHTPKNVLIRAVKSGIPKNKRFEAIESVKSVTEEFGLEPTIVKLLGLENNS